MIDEKKYYLFGRNPDLNDFDVNHASCSRVHAALVYHKHLQRMFLLDLDSTHGTFVGSVRLEGQKPTQIPLDSSFRFGASTRVYTLREKPIQVQANRATGDSEAKCEEADQSCVLPDNQSELDVSERLAEIFTFVVFVATCSNVKFKLLFTSSESDRIQHGAQQTNQHATNQRERCSQN
jgi:pSer/pThr/pTyr-binding forkhead associated (FHA) protein